MIGLAWRWECFKKKKLRRQKFCQLLYVISKRQNACMLGDPFGQKYFWRIMKYTKISRWCSTFSNTCHIVNEHNLIHNGMELSLCISMRPLIMLINCGLLKCSTTTWLTNLETATCFRNSILANLNYYGCFWSCRHAEVKHPNENKNSYELKALKLRSGIDFFLSYG